MIRFDNPAALWLLTLIAPLILLYLLKRKRREVRVPSILLWKQALEDARANTPFQKLRSSLLLLLQVLILVLLTAILSGPHFLESFQPSSRWILVIDNSTSMASTDEKPDRFTLARERLIKSLRQIPANDEIMLIAFSAQTLVLQPFTRSHSLVRTRLLELEREDVASNWQPLIQILLPLFKERPVPRILIASDFSNSPEQLRTKLRFNPVLVGNSGENIAITRAALAAVPGNPRHQILFYEIKNFGKQGRTVEVELHLNGEVIDAYRTRLDSMQAIHRDEEIEIPEPVEVLIRVQPEDALRLDNDFLLQALPADKIRVNLRASNPFLQRALQVLPSVQVSPGGILVSELGSGSIPDAQRSGLYFISGPTESPGGRIVQWNQSHPALRFVDAGLWRFSHYAVLKIPAGAEILMETSEGPIAYSESSTADRKIVLGFSLNDSNVVLLAGFPVFLQNSIEWLAAGQRTVVPVLTGGQYRKEGTVRQGGARGYVNFADAVESNITPQKVQGTSSFDSAEFKGRTDLSTWFLILLILALILEWWVFHRRIEATLQ